MAWAAVTRALPPWAFTIAQRPTTGGPFEVQRSGDQQSIAPGRPPGWMTSVHTSFGSTERIVDFWCNCPPSMHEDDESAINRTPTARRPTLPAWALRPRRIQMLRSDTRVDFGLSSMATHKN